MCFGELRVALYSLYKYYTRARKKKTRKDCSRFFGSACWYILEQLSCLLILFKNYKGEEYPSVDNMTPLLLNSLDISKAFLGKVKMGDFYTATSSQVMWIPWHDDGLL